MKIGLNRTLQKKKQLKRSLKKKTNNGFSKPIIAGQKYCRMLQREHSAILLTFIKLSFVIQISVLSIFEWPLKTCAIQISVLSIFERPLKTGFTVTVIVSNVPFHFPL